MTPPEMMPELELVTVRRPSALIPAAPPEIVPELVTVRFAFAATPVLAPEIVPELVTLRLE